MHYFVIFLVLYSLVIVYGVYKPMPTGLSFEGDVYLTDHVEFLADISYEREGERIYEQSIFQQMMEMIWAAEDFIVIDMFLFNDFYDPTESFPPISGMLTEALIAKKKQHPELDIFFITDPVNTSYYSHSSKHLEQLEKHGITTIVTKLTPLRDSNPLFSGIWRSTIQWFGQRGSGWLPNPSSPTAPKITLRSYLKLFNVKANHRKLVVTEKQALITSANPHDASGYHGNIAFVVNGAIIHDVLKSEQAVATYSHGAILPSYKHALNTGGKIQTQLLTEGKIKAGIIDILRQTEAPEQVWIGMLYLSDRDVLAELLDASKRGAEINIILDQNVESFGHKKRGLPNKPVAEELVQQSNGQIHIRWYETNKEQYHPKIMLVVGDQESHIIGGSANFTRRNLKDLNLESSLRITAATHEPIIQDVKNYFTRIWNNKDGVYTADYERYRDDSWSLRILYKLQKLTNLSTY